MANEIKPVTIPRKVADAIEALREACYDLYGFINAASYDCDITRPEEVEIREYAAAGNATTLMRALLDGYERELTEEEQREKAYEEINRVYNLPLNNRFGDGYNRGIKFTLRALGIEIPGVNVPEQTEGGATQCRLT